MQKQQDNRAKAGEFLAFAAANEARLKRNLRKNITYDGELFEDVWQESLIKCHDSIERNGTDIADYEQYFFICTKWQYIQRANQKKRRRETEIGDYFSDDRRCEIPDVPDEAEERHRHAVQTLGRLNKAITDVFGAESAAIFLEYMNGKANGGTSYREIGEKTGKTANEVRDLVRPVKRWVEETRKMWDYADN